MKKISLLLAVFLLLGLCLSAQAEDAVQVEVLKMDGISVVVLTPQETLIRARGIAEKAGSFALPASLTIIEKGAFEGIAAETVEISKNVVSIEAGAFAYCKSLREITIPDSVLTIDVAALDGCKNVTVYGVKGSAAEKFVEAVNDADPDANFAFVPLKPVLQTPAPAKESPVAVMPFVPAK